MKREEILFLFEYTYWARDRILEKAALLSPQEYAEARPYAQGSIRNTLVHTLNAEWVWRSRCQEAVSPSQPLDPANFPTLPLLQQRWQQEESLMIGYLKELAPTDLEKTIHYRRQGGGEAQADRLWQILVHVVNHGTEHRSVVAAYLTACGHSPGDIDIIQFVRT